MAKKDRLIKSKSIYTIKKQHALTNDATIYENDHITIIPNDGIYDDEMALFSESNFKYRIRTEKNEKKRQELYSKISEMYGKTYTEYKNKLKVKYKKYRDDIRWQGETPLPMKKYFKARKYINEMYSSLFNAIDSNSARTVLEVTEDKFYKGKDEDAINYLENQFRYYENKGVNFDNVPENPFK